jgi:NADH-quinone oxidoreductase subunit L
MWIEHNLYLIVVLPFIGAFVNGMNSFLGNRLPRRMVGWIACSMVFASFVLSVIAFFHLRSLEGEKQIVNAVYEWIHVGHLHLNAGFLLDPLSAVMILVVTGVGFLIHVYSIGYMGKDPGYSRYFSYLNLFTFAMLLLVLGDNILLMFVGWEGVGLCSYLLIGFWFEHKPNAVAGMKAFIVNRIGDYGFLVGIMLLLFALAAKGHATLNFIELREYAPLLGAGGVVTAIAVCFFIGAMGKSAQIPLYVWLPDAMAGPTPVSALIHAATMVTAGVYMIGRLNFLFSASPAALTLVAVVGALTAFYAASIGLAQNDIKKVLAYSTVSQLGYMFLGMGVAAYAAGIFHLMTHAFFKGLLFLGSGSVIHAMSNKQDMREMGGLKKLLPVTYWTFMAATLAIVGVAPFAGFFSKDEILWKTWESGHHFLWLIGFVAAGLTSFYMFRLIALTFFGANRADEETRHHIHESPKVMLVPLVILAVLSLAGGWVGIPKALGGNDAFHHWLSPVFERAGESAATHAAADAGAHGGEFSGSAAAESGGGLELVFAAMSFAWAVLWGFLGFVLYTRKIEVVDKLKSTAGGAIHRVIANKYYVDEIYDFLFVKNLIRLTRASAVFDGRVVDGAVNGAGFLTRIGSFLAGLFDNAFIDGLVNAVANTTRSAGQRLRVIQSGEIQGYLYFLFSLAMVILFLQWII